MLKVNDIVELKIEKLSYGENLIARFGEEKFVVFVKNVVVDDIIEARIVSVNKRFANAEVVKIISPSNRRVKPFCALFNPCGSCQFQNFEYDFLIEQKQIVLKDIFKNVIDEKNILPYIKSPKILQYRHKIQYPIRQTKNSKRILMGYFKNKTHDLINIKHCPIQPLIIDEISNFIRENYSLGCYCEKNNKGLLKNVLFRISNNEENLLITFVLNTNKNEFSLKFKKYFTDFSSKLMEKFKITKGIFVNFNPKKQNCILGTETLLIKGENFIIENLEDKKYYLGATNFFQVNVNSAIKLFNIVKENIKNNSNVLDCYGGVGAIGIFVSEKCSKITLVEENIEATKLAKENFKLNNIKNYEIFSGDAKKHLLDFQNQKKEFDYVILDPPRQGCAKEGLENISKIAKNIIYVSCNPNTQKRDIEILFKQGFKLKSIQGVDLFPYTYHIESVAILEK